MEKCGFKKRTYKKRGGPHRSPAFGTLHVYVCCVPLPPANMFYARVSLPSILRTSACVRYRLKLAWIVGGRTTTAAITATNNPPTLAIVSTTTHGLTIGWRGWAAKSQACTLWRCPFGSLSTNSDKHRSKLSRKNTLFHLA